MTAKDLMVGDLVATGEHTIIRITEIMHQFVGYENKYNLIASYQELNPIPITSEILRQIATYNERGNYWALNGDYYIIDFHRGDGRTYFYANDEAVWRNDYFTYCLYVHELQHILRMIGHRDLADNLK